MSEAIGRSVAIRDLLRVVWACRVSLVSVVAALLLMVVAQPARDLFFDRTYSLGGTILYWIGFYISVVAFWAFPAHYSARLVLREGEWLRPHELSDTLALGAFRRRVGGFVTWVPRVLGASCFVVILVGVVLTRLDLQSARSEETTVAGYDRLLVQLDLLAATTVVVGFLFLIFLIYRRSLLDRMVPMSSRAQVVGGEAYLVIASIGLVALALYPHLANLLPRAVILPVVLGAWIAPFSLLAAWSHRWRFPLIATVLALVVALGVPFFNRHDISRLPGEPAAEQVALGEAVRLWTKHNGCTVDESGRVASADLCGRPIVVIAPGGASRAAFFTASAIGALLDATCAATADGPCDRYPSAARQIFAISAVSGSAVAAVALSAALAEANDDGSPPCVGSDEYGLWFRDRAPNGWRECLQLILAGDFLSAPAAAMIVHDNIPFLSRGTDRGRMIEEAWAMRFSASLGPGRGDERRSLDRPFSAFRPTEDRWLPLLVLNGTSVRKGARILTSHLAALDGQTPVFRFAEDLYGLLRTSDKEQPDDISLATAALNSARFPFISPPGAIVTNDVVRDWIVDGGYLDALGGLTGSEIVSGLRDYGLEPLVLVILNGADLAGQAAAGKPADLTFGAPIMAIFASRVSSYERALAELCTARPRQDIKTCYEVRTFRKKPLSMSWWLSKPVQEMLDAALRGPVQNTETLKQVCLALPQAGKDAREAISNCADRLDATLKIYEE